VGRIAVAGQARTGRTQRSLDFALALLSPGGEFVRSFGRAGHTTTDFGAEDGAGDVAVTPRAGFVLVGSTHRPGKTDTALARYH
jgi:hypothetical protein